MDMIYNILRNIISFLVNDVGVKFAVAILFIIIFKDSIFYLFSSNKDKRLDVLDNLQAKFIAFVVIVSLPYIIPIGINTFEKATGIEVNIDLSLVENLTKKSNNKTQDSQTNTQPVKEGTNTQ